MRTLENETAREPETSIDWGLVLNLLRCRGRRLAIAGAGLWLALSLVCLFLVPRTYTATASVALQQTGSVGNPLELLTGMKGGNQNYQGVIYSRTFAAFAAQQEDIQAIYGLKRERDAVELIQHSVKLEDRMDGLLYIHVNLPAPPRFAFWERHRNELIQAASARIAGDYVQSLQRYLETSNSNRDAALVREAGRQLIIARRSYNHAVNKLAIMLERSPATTIASTLNASAGDDSSGAPGAKTDALSAELQALYLDQSQLGTQIQALNAAQKATIGIVGRSAQSVASLPGEDPLLQQARAQVRMDQIELQNMEVTLSDDNPDVVAARQRLAISQKMLADQSKAIAQGKTTQAIELDSLKARYAAVQQQIRQIESVIKGHTPSTLDLEYQRNEVMLSLEVLKATATQYATLSVSKVAGNNLMDVVDTPLTPPTAQPGIALFAILSFFITLLLLQGWIAAEYMLYRFRERYNAAPGEERKAA